MSKDLLMTQELAKLCYELNVKKSREAIAKQERIRVEEEISGLISNDKMEGSVSVSDDDYSVSVGNGVTRKVDFERLAELDKELPDHLKLVVLKPSLNLKNLRTLEQTAGERFLTGVSEAITITPKKVSVTLKIKEKK